MNKRALIVTFITLVLATMLSVVTGLAQTIQQPKDAAAPGGKGGGAGPPDGKGGGAGA